MSQLRAVAGTPAPRFQTARDLLVLTRFGSTYLVPRTGKTLRLNREASFAWAKLASGGTLSSATASYARRFGLTESDAAEEIEAFASAMRDAGYLVPR